MALIESLPRELLLTYGDLISDLTWSWPDLDLILDKEAFLTSHNINAE